MSMWNGIHHIALATANLDATIQFYRDILQMTISAVAPSKEGRGRHCLILVKENDEDTWGFHFFERPTVGKGAQTLAEVDPTAFLMHIAVRLRDEAAARALRERLERVGTPITDIPELGTFVFPDNNGIILEATWPRTA
ncbi:catechol 2,3-dioxygenase-like lactoylglutathione lyase family enzyme [Thermosporothrix hazakensis]|uniref:Catechol 2,3-dioxygenase-like lactoylglutathione lyase family enzyme n=1 Tax=Thermosporothrix hazakensis TaxID=644383 RepID=A0A326UBM9_THEHA|nr:VOC family protein [Thermosporothrix hazakensis]PZW31092.1 catechol 2,3-dioxygenase-like lactoylglutathione lyase family enzyme [Thermosporothrix hazakensis]GCE50993.1 hypothetical protein KTH_58620 [Thermosporothrix hazakensis]